jgi:hypothetical protein
VGVFVGVIVGIFVLVGEGVAVGVIVGVGVEVGTLVSVAVTDGKAVAGIIVGVAFPKHPTKSITNRMQNARFNSFFITILFSLRVTALGHIHPVNSLVFSS